MHRAFYPAFTRWHESGVLWSHRLYRFDAHGMLVDKCVIQHLLVSHIAFEGRFQRIPVSKAHSVTMG